MSRCRNSYTEQELKPLTLEALGRLCADESADYQHFLQDCVDSLFKEVKEKFKGWVSCSTSEQAELSYKKVGHPSCRRPVEFQGSGLGFLRDETLLPTQLCVGIWHPLPLLQSWAAREFRSPGKSRNQPGEEYLSEESNSQCNPASTESHQSALECLTSGVGLRPCRTGLGLSII